MSTDMEATSRTYRISDKEKYMKGCMYGPMQESDEDYLCPHCGGYGTVCEIETGKNVCKFCNGSGAIQKNDQRIVDAHPEEFVIRLYEEHIKEQEEIKRKEIRDMYIKREAMIKNLNTGDAGREKIT